MKIDLPMLRASWHAWIGADTSRVEPYWLQLLWTALFSVGLAAVFTLFGFVAWAEEVENWLDLPRWSYWFGKNLIVALVVGFVIHGLIEGIGSLIGGPARILRFKTPQSVLFFAGVPALGTLFGAPLGLWLAGAQGMKLFDGDDGQRAIVLSLVFWAAAFVLIYQWFGYKTRAMVAERQHSEAQLRLLQAQIEPHFLFNTLANVNALIEHDPPKARQMLGAFTDYLRAVLSNLRREQAPLADELALAALKRLLPQAAAGERLRWVRAGSGDLTHQIDVAEVLFFRADDKYTCVQTVTGEHLIRTSIQELAAQLDPQHFVQVHRSTIVNLAHLASPRRDEASRLFLRIKGHAAELPVSRAYVHLFRAM